MRVACGIDFGTSNSTVALADGSGAVRQVDIEGEALTAPTLLYFGEEPPPQFGAAAAEAYAAEDLMGRLIQSIKRHLPAAGFEGTFINERFRSLEELVAGYLRFLRAAAEREAGQPVTAALLGRPARFHAEADRDALAQRRLESAARLAGFTEVAFQLEPIAAARRFERSLSEDVLCLVGDFGGGTSDFTVIRLSPRHAGRVDRSEDILGVAGVAVGGNDFDARLMMRTVLPHFGHNTEYQPMGKWMTISPSLHLAVTRWHTACLAATDDNLAQLKVMMRTARDRDGLARLYELLDEGYFFRLFQSVEATKVALSSQEEAPFVFKAGSIDIEDTVQRSDFERAIGRELGKVSVCVDGLLSDLSLKASDIDVVFLTGGSSRVPAVRRLFTERFGDRIAEMEALTSVGFGLGVEAGERLAQGA